METIIYTLSDECEIRYIGKTINFRKRYNSHINESVLKRTHKEKWINKTLTNSGKIIMEILDICEEKESDFIESYWISQFKTWGFNLVNLTSGGEGGSPMKGKKKKPMSDETKLKISEKKKGIVSPNKGNKYNDVIKLQMSLSRLGVKRNDDVKKILSECKKIIWVIKTPNGEIVEFFGYNSFKKFVSENSLDVSVTTLKSYGKNKGWEIINKIKK